MATVEERDDLPPEYGKKVRFPFRPVGDSDPDSRRKQLTHRVRITPFRTRIAYIRDRGERTVLGSPPKRPRPTLRGVHRSPGRTSVPGG